MYNQTEMTGRWLNFRLALFELGFENQSKDVEVNITLKNKIQVNY